MEEKDENLSFIIDLDVEKLKQQATEANNVINQIGKDTSGATNNVNTFVNNTQHVISDINDKAEQASDKIHEIGEQAQNTGEIFSKLGRYVAGYFALGTIKGFAQQIFAVRSEMQALETSFQVLLGDKEAATELFSSIKDFAVNTPMELPTLAKGAQTLLSFGIANEKVMPVLKQIGDLSMGNADKFNSLVLAYSQMTSTGKLMGQDLMQMINAGFNPLNEIAKNTGKSIGELKDEMSKGKLTLEEVQKAFETATTAGGQFDGMVEKQSKTLGGAMSNYQGAIQDMQNELGERFEGVFAEAIDIATILVKNYKILANAIEVVAAAYGTYKAATLAVIAIEKVERVVQLYKAYGSLSKMIKASTAAQAAFNLVAKANPLFLVASALVGATVAFMKYKKSVDEAREKEESYNGQLESAKNTLEERVKLIKQYTAEVRQSEKVTQKQIESFRKLISLDPKLKELFSSVEQLRDMTDVQLEANIQEYADSNTLDAQRKILKNAQDKIIEYRKKIEDLEEDDNNGNGSVASGAVIAEYEEKIKKLSKVVVEASHSISQYWEDVDSAFKSNDDTDTRTAELDYIKQVNKDLVDGNLTLEERKKIYQDLLEYEKNTPDYIRSEDTIKAVKTFEKEIKREEEERKARLRTAKKADEDFKEEQKRFEKEHELEVRQAKLDLQEESLQKEIDQINLNKDRTLEAIKNAEKAKLEEYKRSKYNEYIVKSNGTSKMTYDQWEEKNGANVQLPSGVKAIYNEQATNAENKAKNDTKQAYKSALEEYLTFQEQMLLITEKYAKKRADLEKNGNFSSENAELMAKQEKEEQEALAISFAEKKEEYQRFLIDVGYMTLTQAEDELEKLSAQLTSAKMKIGDKEQAKNVEMLTAKCAKLTEQIKQLKLEEYEASKSNAELFGKKVNTKAWESVGDSVSELSSAFGSLSKNSSGALKEISEGAEMFLSSTSTIINGISKLSQIASQEIVGVSKTAVSAIKAMEYASVILTVLSAALSIYQQIKSALGKSDNSESIRQYNQDISDLKISVRDLKHEALLDNDNNNSIFSNNLWEQSSKNIKSATIAMDEYTTSLSNAKSNIDSYNRSLYRSALNSGFTKSASKWDEYDVEDFNAGLRTLHAQGLSALSMEAESLADTLKYVVSYSGKSLVQMAKDAGQELFSEDGWDGVNMDVLRSIMDTDSFQEFPDAVRQALEEAYSAFENYEKACEEVKSSLESVFGSLGDDIMDALVEAFESGTDAAKSFSESAIDSVSKMLETFEKQMIYKNVFQEYFDKASQAMQETTMTDFTDTIMDMEKRIHELTIRQGESTARAFFDTTELKKVSGISFDDFVNLNQEQLASLADQLKMDEYGSIMGTLTEQVIGAQEEANDLLLMAQQMGEKYGLDLFGNSSSDVSASKSQGLASASQDSIDELNGRITAIQGHTYNIWQNSDILVDVTNDILIQVSQINSNTQRLSSIENTLNSMATKGIKVLS